MRHSLSFFFNSRSKTCLSNEQVSCVSKWGISPLIYIRPSRVKCLFTGRADLSNWVVITTFNIFWGLFNICWGRLLILPIIVIFWPIRKRGFGPITITDIINRQWGLIQWIIYQIIIRILFTVTLFQRVQGCSLEATHLGPLVQRIT